MSLMVLITRQLSRQKLLDRVSFCLQLRTSRHPRRFRRGDEVIWLRRDPLIQVGAEKGCTRAGTARRVSPDAWQLLEEPDQR